MDQGRFRRWLLLPGALAAAGLLGTACEREKPLPRTGSDYEGVANEAQPLESFVPDQPGPQDRSGAQGSQGGIGAPGFTTPREGPTDQGGTRRWEENSGTSNRTMQPGAEQGPRSPPDIDAEQAPKQ